MLQDYIVDEIVRAFQERRLVFCVGPHLTSVSVSKEELVDRLLAHARASMDIDGPSIRRKSSAQALHALRKSLTPPAYSITVEKILANSSEEIPELARNIARLTEANPLSGQIDSIYTTNLDNAFERALRGRWPVFPEPKEDLVQRKSLLFKICGTLEIPDTWVLTIEEIQRAFTSPFALRQRVFRAAFHSKKILFIGFDIYDEFFQALIGPMATTALARPSHFICVPGANAEDVDLLASQGLISIDSTPTEIIKRLTLEFMPDRVHELTETVLEAPPIKKRPKPKPRGKQRRARTFEITTQSHKVPTSPYPGLKNFREWQHEIFFGREVEISDATSRLGSTQEVDEFDPSHALALHHRWLAIEGPSGVGKSSFVHAGVIPALKKGGFAPNTPGDWLTITLRPGSKPLLNLAEALRQTFGELGDFEGYSTKVLANYLADSPRNLTRLIEHEIIPWTDGRGILFVIDQLEECVTLASPEDSVKFTEAVADSLETADIYLISTLRTDLLDAFSSRAPSLNRILQNSARRYRLLPISRAGLREAIEYPAKMYGASFEDDLVDEILKDASALQTQTGRLTDLPTLPLVAHVLRALWDAGAADDGLIQKTEYEKIGKVAGALGKSADRFLYGGDNAAVGLDESEQKCVKALLLKLASKRPEGGYTRVLVRKRSAVRILGRGDMTVGGELLDRLVGEARILVIHEKKEGGEPVVDIIHESLFDQWETLREWLEECHTKNSTLATLQKLMKKAHQWEAGGRVLPKIQQKEYGEALSIESEVDNAEDPTLLREYREAVIAARENRNRVVRFVAAGIVTISMASTFMFYRLWDNAQVQRQEAEKARLIVEEREKSLEKATKELGKINKSLKRSIRENYTTLAQLHGVRAANVNDQIDKEERLGRALDAVDALRASDGRSILEVEKGLAAALRATKRWGRDTNLIAMHDAKGSVKSIVDYRGYTFFADAKGHVYKWNATEHKSLDMKRIDEGNILSLTPTQDSIVVSFEDRTFVKIDEDLNALTERERFGRNARFTQVDGGSMSFVAGTKDGQVWFGALDAPQSADKFKSKVGVVKSAAFGPGGHYVALGGFKHFVSLFDTRAGAEPREIPTWQETPIKAMAFSRHGDLFVAGDSRGSLVGWNLEGEVVRTWRDIHDGQIVAIAFSPDGKKIATSGTDWTIKVLDLSRDDLHDRATLQGHENTVYGLEFSSDSSKLLSLGLDTKIRVWGVDSGLSILTLVGHTRRILTAHFSANGSTIRSGGNDRKFRVWAIDCETMVAKVCAELGLEDMNRCTCALDEDIPDVDAAASAPIGSSGSRH